MRSFEPQNRKARTLWSNRSNLLAESFEPFVFGTVCTPRTTNRREVQGGAKIAEKLEN